MFKLYDGKVTLNVTCDSPLDEVFLIDSGLERIGKGIGGLVMKDLDPGVYKLKFKSGDAVVEKSVVLNEPDVTIQGDQIQLITAVPLQPPPAPIVVQPLAPVKLKKSGARAKPAAPKPIKVAVPPPSFAPKTQTQWNGTGSGLFFYLHAKDAAGAKRILSSAQIIDEHGDALGTTTAKSAVYSQAIDCVPGHYILRVDAGEAGLVDLCLTASPGWCTCVFMPSREVGCNSMVEVPDVLNAGILYARLGQELSPSDPNLRWTEQLRLALLAGRPVASKEEFERYLSQDWHQPMYLLLGAHLLLLEPEVDRSLLSRVLDRLESLLPNHQDVALLRLYSSKDDVPSPPRMMLEWPPLLAHTFRLLEHPFMRDRVAVVPGSLAETALMSPWTGSTWFLWRARRTRPPGSMPQG